MVGFGSDTIHRPTLHWGNITSIVISWPFYPVITSPTSSSCSVLDHHSKICQLTTLTLMFWNLMQGKFWCLILLQILLSIQKLPIFILSFFNLLYIFTLFQLKAICTCTPDSAESRGHNSLGVQIRMHCYSLQWVWESVQSHWQAQVRNSGDFRANCTKHEFYVKKAANAHFHMNFMRKKLHFMLNYFMVK